MNYREMMIADLRLVLLRILAAAPGYECGASVLRAAAERYGHAVGRDVLVSELHWLAEQGLVTLVDDTPLLVATLAARGLDVSRGLSQVPGVARPEPE